jgi:hypothetical protein
MFNLIVVATGLFMGQYDDRASCQSAIRAIYFQRLAPHPELLVKSELNQIGKTLEIVVKTQREFICIPAKKG